ncbi:hypothetical protein GW7_13047 [Heterocephalus glaber]|uniref:Uncharacterized protein n=1 Tax=Heterocephalus glaber TaxID=10181 RepID=G5BN56_HETGA|nr:hypothetical protein GW7_13047 [Heterocephalus glaber]
MSKRKRSNQSLPLRAQTRVTIWADSGKESSEGQSLKIPGFPWSQDAQSWILPCPSPGCQPVGGASPGSSLVGGKGPTEDWFADETAPASQGPELSRRVELPRDGRPHSPHTISNRTISSVATKTSRVSPTLCHILAASGRGQHAGFSCGWRGPGAAWAAGAPRQRPPEVARRREVHHDRSPTLLLSGADGAGRPYPLIVLGSRGRGARRPRRWPDALPWRTLCV